jgi:hypothetical protein
MLKHNLSALLLLVLCSCAKNTSTDQLLNEEVKPVPTETTSMPAAKLNPMPLFNKERFLLYDPRKPPESPTISKEEGEALLDKLFEKRLRQGENCNGRESRSVDEDILAGQIRPLVITKTSGAFTAVGLQQTLYVVDVNECNAMPTRIGSAGTIHWVIMTGDAVTRREKDGFRADWVIPVDLDQNGTKEILAVNSSEVFSDYIFGRLFIFPTNPATVSSGISLLESFAPEAFQEDNCNGSNNKKLSKRLEPGEKGIKKLSVWYLNPTEPGKLPEFIEEKFTAACEKDAPYKPAP